VVGGFIGLVALPQDVEASDRVAPEPVGWTA
jgi:hypothetical protein